MKAAPKGAYLGAWGSSAERPRTESRNAPPGHPGSGPVTTAAGERKLDPAAAVPADLPSFRDLLEAKRVELCVKRLLDLAGALVGLALVSPILLLAALLVRVSSSGPVIFCQTRVGRFGRPFTLYKLRTMRVQWDPAWAAAHVSAARHGLLLKAKQDPRVTRIGALLRATSVDELPQLVNVLKGDMSLVGPRPLLPLMLAPHPDFSQARSLLRPGLTGLWQIRDREHNTCALAMRPHDLEYLRRFSLWLDLLILLRTPQAVASQRGAC